MASKGLIIRTPDPLNFLQRNSPGLSTGQWPEYRPRDYF
jgi:hypothetical protein